MLTLALLAACGSPSSPGECTSPRLRDDLPDLRTVELGVLSSVRFGEDGGTLMDRFDPYGVGEEHPLIPGFQGGYMLLPVVRVSAGASAEPTACLHIALRNTMDVPVEQVPDQARTLDRVGDHFYSPQLFNLLAFDPGTVVDRDLTMQATVTGPDFRSSSPPVTVTLRAPP